MTSFRPSFLYNLGRVISYTVVGGIVGAIGSVVSFSGMAKGIVAILAGVFMIIMGLNMLNLFPWLRRFAFHLPRFLTRGIDRNKHSNSPLYVGLLNGLMPCGPLQAMQLFALSTGSPVSGALSMFFFSLGTVPLMFGFGALSSLLSKKFTDKMLRTAISKYLKSEGRTVAPETILNYIKACEDAFLFYRVRRQDLQGKKILTVNEKYYIADHGIREAVFGGNMKDINLIFENIVYIELLRRGYKVTVGKAGEKKIDFIAEKQTQKLYVQVAYLLASEETIQREFGAYDTIRDNFPKYVVSYDEFDMSRDGLKHMNIREFLLSKQWD